MAGRVERLLRAADRFQQRHAVLAVPVAVVKKFGDGQAGKLPDWYQETLRNLRLAGRRPPPSQALSDAERRILRLSPAT
jgi:hypothetical protein